MTPSPQKPSGQVSRFKSAGAPPPGAGASVVPVAKYASVPHILIKRARQREQWQDWIKDAWRDEGLFRRYLRMEKHTTEQRVRQVGRQMEGWQQNNKSELRLRAAVPMREFMRWKAKDKHFWEDDSNLRSLKRDNPNMHIVT